MKKAAIWVIAVAVIIGGGIVFLANSRNTQSSSTTGGSQSNVVTTGGKQVIEIDAKGGYSPRNTVAKADTPTVLKVKTNGTFDCSSALTIPSLAYRANLPSSGETLIEVPPQKAGSTLRGICAMGMYNFEVDFS